MEPITWLYFDRTNETTEIYILLRKSHICRYVTEIFYKVPALIQGGFFIICSKKNRRFAQINRFRILNLLVLLGSNTRTLQPTNCILRAPLIYFGDPSEPNIDVALNQPHFLMAR